MTIGTSHIDKTLPVFGKIITNMDSAGLAALVKEFIGLPVGTPNQNAISVTGEAYLSIGHYYPIQDSEELNKEYDEVLMRNFLHQIDKYYGKVTKGQPQGFKVYFRKEPEITIGLIEDGIGALMLEKRPERKKVYTRILISNKPESEPNSPKGEGK